MSTMNRLPGLVILLIALGSLPRSAQPASRPAGSGNDGPLVRIRALLNDLALTDVQKGKVNDILDRAGENFRAIASDLKEMAAPERQQKVREFMMDIHEQVSAELIPEQKEKLDRAMQALRGGSGATTRPAAGGGAAQLMVRMRAALGELGLSDEQKTEIRKLLAEAGENIRKISSGAERGGQEMRQKGTQLLEQTMESIKQVLTAEQFEKLRTALRSGANPAPASQPRMTDDKMKDDKMMDEKMSSMDDMKSSAKSSKADDTPSPSIAQGPQAGAEAPGFSLQKIGGQPLQLSAFNGKVVVLTFASYSSPTFRRRAAALEDIRNKYESRADFLLIYTKEAHPKGGWEVGRNKDDEIAIEDAKDPAGREKQAKKMQSALRLNFPTLLDSMDDAAAKAYGAGECTTFIINRDGTICSRLQWSDPYTLKRQLDEVLTVKPTTRTN